MPGQTSSRRALLAALAVALAAGPASAPRAEPPVDWQGWDSVEQLSGTYERTVRCDEEWKDGPHSVSSHETGSSHITFVLKKQVDSQGRFFGGWKAEKGELQGSYTLDSAEEFPTSKMHASASFGGAVDDLDLRIDLKKGEWLFCTGGRLKWPYTVHKSGGTLSHGEWDETEEDQVRTSYESGCIRAALPAGRPGALAGSFHNEQKSSWYPKGSICTIEARVQLSPGVQLLELVVTSEGYQKWRPSASDSGGPGAPLTFKARVQNADGSKPTVEVDTFDWKLTGTSREPGVALNFPQLLNKTDGREADLKLDGLPDHAASDQDAQQAIGPGRGRLEDEVRVVPQDWGGWSALTVTATLRDGRKLTGKLKGSPEPSILLPRRAKDSYIADSWKEANGIAGKDSDDAEAAPAGEPGCNGDGLTLYEEYRGFYEKGKHVSGNPKKKDFFIFNRCGAVARPGIALFARLTALEVHQDLLEDEVSYLQGDHAVMNGNFDKGPHRVLQHRVELTECGATRSNGGGTRARTAAAGERHLRPKDVQNLYVEGPEQSYWGQLWSVSSGDRPRQFDVAVAHELLHSVGVEHHGEGNAKVRFEVRAASTPSNPSGRARWVARLPGGDSPVTFLDERDADVGSSSAAAAVQVTPGFSAVMAGWGLPGEAAQATSLYVGIEHGESSGDEGCVMRYWMAAAYPKKGASDTLYLVPPGSEPVGDQLCSGTAGQTINGPRSPQPRYFGAAEGRGQCRQWVCVNDAIPGKPVTSGARR
jgi:hypothetical protein